MSDETTPVTPPSTAARFQSQKTRRRNQGASLSGRDADLERLDGVENTGESTLDTNDEGSEDTPHSFPSLPLNVLNGRDSPGVDKEATPASSPPTSEELMPIWRLEDKIMEIILKAAAKNDGQKLGQAYIFGDPTNKAGYFKLGKSETPTEREKRHQHDCEPSFRLLGCIPRAGLVPWFGRLESLALAELTNMKYSFDCRCSTSHREYFRGSVDEGLEILNCWSSWLQRNPNPYGEELQLSPFWTDRLRLLRDKTFSHSRCPNTKCRSADIRSSTCQACLRLRLKAWTDVTDFDYFEYECRMRVGWKFLRQVMLWMWRLFGDHLLILIHGWEKVKSLATLLWAPVTHLHFLLLLLWCLSRVPPESINSIIFYGIACPLSYWRIMKELTNTPFYSQFGKVQKIPPARGKKATTEASNSPRPETPPEIFSGPETPHEQEPPSRKRSVSVHEPLNDSRNPRGHESATTAHEMSETPTAEDNGPKPFLTPDRATRTVTRSPRASAKRRKSDVR
ncbi:hypothetical protein CDV55_107851 [Aspergillus turcosus]|uniref:Bacteriophage T5 Orf172 DNA-binding domain-containing protein n=1 Tax=Aspergillus turcosus TaxID=1245748 RepID=A0A229XAQ2_9EURO|nr:hypothetical protein CDV55_107851 [Aspergillus turcosus]RLL97646.1 hypothetical protein CFD26_100935 [Aspergillus turcosus]